MRIETFDIPLKNQKNSQTNKGPKVRKFECLSRNILKFVAFVYQTSSHEKNIFGIGIYLPFYTIL